MRWGAAVTLSPLWEPSWALCPPRLTEGETRPGDSWAWVLDHGRGLSGLLPEAPKETATPSCPSPTLHAGQQPSGSVYLAQGSSCWPGEPGKGAARGRDLQRSMLPPACLLPTCPGPSVGLVVRSPPL